jgi:hypothetical protein
MATTLRFRHAALAFFLPMFAGTGQAADEALPPSFAAIVTAPSDLSGLEMHAVINHDGDGEGEEMPSAKVYFEAESKDFATSMTVTDFSLCKRPAEHALCLAFRNQISAAAPSLSTDITDTRIGGAGYHTLFLARLGGIQLPGADATFAFLAGDTQDGPPSELVLYIYARRGTNLVQVTGPAGRCEGRVRPGESEVAYYQRACLSESLLARARKAGTKLAKRFRLAPSKQIPQQVQPKQVPPQ